MHIPDLSEELYSSRHFPPPADGWRRLSVGWLGDTVPTEGESPPWVADFLKSCAVVRAKNRYRGWHDCEICKREGTFDESIKATQERATMHGNGEFEVPDEDRRTIYVLPCLVSHYVEAHGYALPAPVLAALEKMRGEP